MKTVPYAHQQVAFDLSKDEEVFALFMEMGTGKSKVAIDNISYLYKQGKIDRAVIIGNKGSYANWAMSEIPTHLSDEVPRDVFVRKSGASVKTRLRYKQFLESTNCLHILIVNVESLITKDCQDALTQFLSEGSCFVVMDESTTIKNLSAQRTKLAIKLFRKAAYRRILTGSPITNSPIDLFSQCEFLNPGLLGTTSYYTFRNIYCALKPLRLGNRTVQVVTGYRNLDKLAKRLEGFSIRTTKEECLDLPAKIYSAPVMVGLTKEQLAMYRELKRQLLTQVAAGVMVTAKNALVMLSKLQQITCGFILDEFGEGHEIPSNRISTLHSLLDECPAEQVIIWATHRLAIQAIAKSLRVVYGEGACVTYFGADSDTQRASNLAGFKSGEHRFLVSNPTVGGFGLTLTNAKTVIYYNNGFSLEHRLQSEDRCHRLGQKFPVTYIDLVSPGTVDEKILQALRQKRSLAATVLQEELLDWVGDI